MESYMVLLVFQSNYRGGYAQFSCYFCIFIERKFWKISCTNRECKMYKIGPLKANTCLTIKKRLKQHDYLLIYL